MHCQSPRCLPTIAERIALVEEVGSPECKCPAFDLGPHWHTEAQHKADDCGGWTWDPPCGGCWGCIATQVAYYSRNDPEPLVAEPVVRFDETPGGRIFYLFDPSTNTRTEITR